MEPSDALIRWVGGVTGAEVTVLRGLRDGGSPWLIRVAGESAYEAVLRVGISEAPDGIATEAAALEIAREHGVPAPQLIAADTEGADAGIKALLESALPGNSRIPVTAAPDRLRAAGTAVAALSRIERRPTHELPLRTRPIPAHDFAAGRRASGAATTSLLRAADERIAAHPIPAADLVLVHGDLWHGNLLWHDEHVTAILDWDMAGVGHHGVDLGAMRLDATLLYGAPAANLVLDGWRRGSGRAPDALAYWDAVAALNTPAGMAQYVPVIHDQGRRDLDAATLSQRRNDFLRSALDGL